MQLFITQSFLRIAWSSSPPAAPRRESAAQSALQESLLRHARLAVAFVITALVVLLPAIYLVGVFVAAARVAMVRSSAGHGAAEGDGALSLATGLALLAAAALVVFAAVRGAIALWRTVVPAAARIASPAIEYADLVAGAAVASAGLETLQVARERARAASYAQSFPGCVGGF